MKKYLQESERRKILSHFFHTLVEELVKKGETRSRASSLVRQIWREEGGSSYSHGLPLLIEEDGFLRMYARGDTLTPSFSEAMHRRIREDLSKQEVLLSPLFLGETLESFFDVNATPPGFLSKISQRSRLRKEGELIAKIQSDLEKVAHIGELEKRRVLTLAILAHGASYRELEGKVLYIPTLVSAKNELIAFGIKQHLLWEGIKTLSIFPMEQEEEERGIYLCQGTEIWPSQPSMLGSIFANFGKEGAATEPYAHSWRQIHKHLRELSCGNLPYVAGHSMGGSLAIQIMLYSHALIEKAYVYNSQGVGERDYRVYKRFSSEVRQKLHLFVNLDDLPFWRMGAKVVGHVTCYIGERRWKYRTIKKWEVYALIPAMVKSIGNMLNALPAHQKIVPLHSSYVYFNLSPSEIAQENAERVTRFDYLDFLPKFYLPLRGLLRLVRRLFGWQLFEEYIKSQIEIIELHEEELREIISHHVDSESVKQLEELARAKEELYRRLLKRR